MEIKDWPSAGDMNPIYKRVRELELEERLFELNTVGLTVIERAISEEVVDAARRALLKVAESRGCLESNATSKRPDQYRGVGVLLHYLLFEDPIFERLLMHPTALALIDYLVGDSCLLSSFTGMIKGHNQERSTLHTDNGMVPSPFPPYAQVANATWTLTNYTREGGCLCYVPGSHLLCRHPNSDERLDEDLLCPVEAPAGSLIIWNGNLWHGGLPKETADLRLNLIMLFCRMYCITQEVYGDRVPPEVLKHHEPRFSRLMGLHVGYGWDAQGPDFSHHDRQKYLELHRAAHEHLFG
jgi:ectoine hydroxylase-related dioxygenase (phytanoyl-CoA dioxygenase family)